MYYAEFTARIFWTLKYAETVLGCPQIFFFLSKDVEDWNLCRVYAEFTRSLRGVDGQ